MQWLERTLSDIPEHYPVVIVDNASTDTTVSYIKKHYPQHILFEETTNLGFGQANNKGIAHALSQDATAVFLLNQDAYLEPDTIQLLEERSDENPAYGILSPVHYNGDGTTLDNFFSRYMAHSRVPRFYRDAIRQEFQPIYEVSFVNAAAWYIPKHILETIGGFDPIFFHYGEDDNYIQRLVFHDFKVGVVPASTIYHDRGDRKRLKPKAFSTTYFKNVERLYKVRYANIGLPDFDNQITQQQTVLLKHALKSSVRLQWRRSAGYLKERKLLKQWAQEMINSRQQNKSKGAHYL